MRPIPPENAPDTLAREIKRWKTISALLLVAILVLGLFSAYLLRSLAQDYDGLIDRSVPVLNEVRVLSNGALSTQRALLAGLLAADDGARTRAITRAQDFIDSERSLRRIVVERDIFRQHAGPFTLLAEAGANYETAVSEVLALMKQGRIPEANAFRRSRVKPALDRYLERLDISARYVESRSQKTSDDYQDTARSRSAMLMGLASLPLLLGMLLVVVIIGLVVVMILIFRRLGPDEGR